MKIRSSLLVLLLLGAGRVHAAGAAGALSPLEASAVGVLRGYAALPRQGFNGKGYDFTAVNAVLNRLAPPNERVAAVPDAELRELVAALPSDALEEMSREQASGREPALTPEQAQERLERQRRLLGRLGEAYEQAKRSVLAKIDADAKAAAESGDPAARLLAVAHEAERRSFYGNEVLIKATELRKSLLEPIAEAYAAEAMGERERVEAEVRAGLESSRFADPRTAPAQEDLKHYAPMSAEVAVAALNAGYFPYGEQTEGEHKGLTIWESRAARGYRRVVTGGVSEDEAREFRDGLRRGDSAVLRRLEERITAELRSEAPLGLDELARQKWREAYDKKKGGNALLLNAEIKLNTAFAKVIAGCASVARPNGSNPWISLSLLRAYSRLHAANLAHSIEVWHGEELVGGAYGELFRKSLSMESMFLDRTKKKLADRAGVMAFTGSLVLAALLGLSRIDSQVVNGTTGPLGAEYGPRADHMETVDVANEPVLPGLGEIAGSR